MRLLPKAETQPTIGGGIDYRFNSHTVLWVRFNDDNSIRKLTIWYK